MQPMFDPQLASIEGCRGASAHGGDNRFFNWARM
jgi:hypothetical protein